METAGATAKGSRVKESRAEEMKVAAVTDQEVVAMVKVSGETTAAEAALSEALWERPV